MARGGVALLLALGLAGAAGEWRPHALRQQRGSSSVPVTTPTAWTTTPAARFAQRVDHFDALNGATWQQRYFVNATFWEAAGRVGPVFLCVGGEGACALLRVHAAARQPADPCARTGGARRAGAAAERGGQRRRALR
jgi:hypothetical protein